MVKHYNVTIEDVSSNLMQYVNGYAEIGKQKTLKLFGYITLLVQIQLTVTFSLEGIEPSFFDYQSNSLTIEI